MLGISKKKKVYSISEFLHAPQQEKQSCAHPKQLYGLFGIDITPHSLVTSGFNGPIIFVVTLGAFCLALALGEYLLRANGLEVIADGLQDTMSIVFPVGFYLYLIIGIISVF